MIVTGRLLTGVMNSTHAIAIMYSFISHIQKDEHHPFHSSLTKLRSGRLQSYKHQAAIGSDSFIRHFISVVNNSSECLDNVLF